MKYRIEVELNTSQMAVLGRLHKLLDREAHGSYNIRTLYSQHDMAEHIRHEVDIRIVDCPCCGYPILQFQNAPDEEKFLCPHCDREIMFYECPDTFAEAHDASHKVVPQ
jgi:formylmethanofuran dehydrogenase subunit E